MSFVMCIIQYLVIFLVTVGVIAVAVAIGINLSKKKDAKKAAEANQASENIEE